MIYHLLSNLSSFESKTGSDLLNSGDSYTIIVQILPFVAHPHDLSMSARFACHLSQEV